MSIEIIQQNMDAFLELLRHYDELTETKMKTKDKKELKKIEEDIEKTRNYLLKLVAKVKELVNEERKNVQA